MAVDISPSHHNHNIYAREPPSRFLCMFVGRRHTNRQGRTAEEGNPGTDEGANAETKRHRKAALRPFENQPLTKGHLILGNSFGRNGLQSDKKCCNFAIAKTKPQHFSERSFCRQRHSQMLSADNGHHTVLTIKKKERINNMAVFY